MEKPPCIFCDLIRADSAHWVAQEASAVAFRPLPDSELAPGHTLVTPRTHVPGLLDAMPEQLAATMSLVQRLAQTMRSALGATGTVVLQASGPDSGGSVAHLHFHVVPCWADDGTTFWPAQRSAHRAPGDPHALLAAALT